MSTAQPQIKKIEMPVVAAFLREPHDYKAMWGGRLGVKTWSMGRQLVINGAQRSLRWLFCRELQKSISDSVHLLLSDQIKLLGLEAYYDVQQNAIYGRQACNKDTRFVFTGLRSIIHDATALKAFESFDGAWVEEAQNISKESLRTLIPTFRKAGVEIWFSFNPLLETDPIIDFLFKHPPQDLAIAKTSWRDNLWLSDKAKRDMERLKAADPDEYEHVYEGAFLKKVEGAVFGRELDAMLQAGRETKVAHDPRLPVYTYWDIGDHWTAIWFCQHFPLEYHLIDYRCFELAGLADIFRELSNLPYSYAKHVMTRDAKSPQLSTGETIEQQARKLAGGDKIRVLDITTVKAQISAAKKIFPLCYFDQDKCADGLHGLRHYRFPPLGTAGVEHDKPLHDWASHPGSAFQTFAVGSGRFDDQQLTEQPAADPVPVQNDIMGMELEYAWMQ